VYIGVRPAMSDKVVQSACEGILQTLQEDDKLLYFAACVGDPLKILGHRSLREIAIHICLKLGDSLK
jgi:hypothetical protein